MAQCSCGLPFIKSTCLSSGTPHSLRPLPVTGVRTRCGFESARTLKRFRCSERRQVKTHERHKNRGYLISHGDVKIRIS